MHWDLERCSQGFSSIPETLQITWSFCLYIIRLTGGLSCAVDSPSWLRWAGIPQWWGSSSRSNKITSLLSQILMESMPEEDECISKLLTAGSSGYPLLLFVTKTCPTLCSDPVDHSLQAPLSVGFPRQAYWSALPFPSPGYLPKPGMEPTSPALAGGFSTAEPQGKPWVGWGDPNAGRRSSQAGGQGRVFKLWMHTAFLGGMPARDGVLKFSRFISFPLKLPGKRDAIVITLSPLAKERQLPIHPEFCLWSIFLGWKNLCHQCDKLSFLVFCTFPLRSEFNWFYT